MSQSTFSVPETVESTLVAISSRLTHYFAQNDWTIASHVVSDLRTVQRSVPNFSLFGSVNGGGCGGAWPCDEVTHEGTIFSVYKPIRTLVMYYLASTTVVIIFDCYSLCIKHGCEKFSAPIRVVKASKDFCRCHNCEHIHFIRK